MAEIEKAVLELIRLTSTELPDDVVQAIEDALERETEGATARFILSRYLENIRLARENNAPLCQDTGLPIFQVSTPPETNRESIRAHIMSAVVQATELQYLRPNAVDPLTGKNSGNNTGIGFPAIEFHDSADGQFEITLLLKGGGSENVSAQYSLPYPPLDAGRDIDGVRKVVVDAVRKAEGKGCPPGVIGVCIGGDRESGFRAAKKQFLRRLDDMNPDETLRELEHSLLEEINRLGIGPQGLGGKTTLLGVKATSLHRLPASYFVTISYMCWAFRRRRLIIETNGGYRIV